MYTPERKAGFLLNNAITHEVILGLSKKSKRWDWIKRFPMRSRQAAGERGMQIAEFGFDNHSSMGAEIKDGSDFLDANILFSIAYGSSGLHRLRACSERRCLCLHPLTSLKRRDETFSIPGK
jgi:hypothetical protein